VNAVAITDIVSTAAFLLAGVFALRASTERVGWPAKVLLCTCMCIYVFVSVANVLEHSGATASLDIYEDYAEILFFPFLLYFLYSMHIHKVLAQRERAEASLRAEHTKLEAVTRHVGIGLTIISRDHRTVWANDVLKELFGDVEGRPCYEVYRKHTAVCPTCELDRILDGSRERVVQELPGRDAQGNRNWSQIIATPVHDEQGNVVGALEAVVPITERRLAEEALREAELEKQTILDSLVEHVVHQDREMKILWANRSACESVGMTREQVIGRHCHELWGEQDEPCDDCPVMLAIRTGVPQNIEKTTPDGRSWSVHGYPVRDSSGTIIGGSEVTLETTERKRAEAALRDSEENLAITLESIGDAVVATDLVGRITRMNCVAEELTGWPAADAVGCPLCEVVQLIAADSREPLADPATEVLATRRVLDMTGQVILVARDGTERRIADSSAPIRDRNGHTVGAVLVFRDVTDRHHLQQELIHAQKMETVGRLAGGIAHDFNNLLLAIIGYSDMALNALDEGDPLYADIEEVRTAGQRAASLTRQLLAFSRKQVLQMRPVDLNQVIGEIDNMLRRVIGEDIELVTRLDPDIGIIEADPAQIQLVLMNLAVNARDAMPDGGTLTIETARRTLAEEDVRARADIEPGDYVFLTVSDTGDGIPDHVMAHLFEPFFTTKDVDKGTGLGLSTVYGIVKQHNGAVWADSEVGVGATFRICFPQVDGTPPPPAEDHDAADSGPAVGTLLVVEDEDVVRTLACDGLAEQGYTVLRAANAAEALRQAESHDGVLDLLLTDLIMPGMNGEQLYHQLARRRPEMKVVYMSGHAHDVIAHHGVLDPGIPFLAKPFSLAALRRTVREALKD